MFCSKEISNNDEIFSDLLLEGEYTVQRIMKLDSVIFTLQLINVGSLVSRLKWEDLVLLR